MFLPGKQPPLALVLPISDLSAASKGLDRLILVSDAAYLGGLKPGLYKWNDVEVRVFDDGHLGLPDTESLAGAAHLLDWDIPRFMEFTGYRLEETIPLCTYNPALILSTPDNYGKLESGAPANLVVFDYEPAWNGPPEGS